MRAKTTLQEDERRRRVLEVSRLGWEAALEAEQMLKAGTYKGWSRAELGSRYLEVCAWLGEQGTTLCSSGCRIDDEYIDWEREHGAECRALAYALHHAV